MKTLFLDLFLDPKARPIFVYALVTVLVASALFHWLELAGFDLLRRYHLHNHWLRRFFTDDAFDKDNHDICRIERCGNPADAFR